MAVKGRPDWQKNSGQGDAGQKNGGQKDANTAVCSAGMASFFCQAFFCPRSSIVDMVSGRSACYAGPNLLLARAQGRELLVVAGGIPAGGKNRCNSSGRGRSRFCLS